MNFKDHLSLANALLPAVLDAGRVEMRHFIAGVVVETKIDTSPVTVADREAEAVLLAALSRVAPGVPVIAEESVSAGIVPAVGSTFFLVDPLDGTRDFIEGTANFTINIGLIQDDKPVFGMIYAPARGLLSFTSGPSAAAEAQLGPAAEQTTIAQIALKEIRTREPDLGAITALASPRHRRVEVDAFMARFPNSSRALIGSSLKFCLIARGDADLYPRFGSINEWDTAAGHAVLSAAGGTVTGFNAAQLSYGKARDRFLHPDFVAWGRPSLVEALGW